MSTLPRVTHILEDAGLGPDFGAVATDVLEAARVRGSAVHRLTEAHHYAYLDEAEITAEVAPYFSGYLKFLAESGHEPIASEVEVIHPSWNYCGHLDRVGWLSGRRGIIDYKTGESVDLLAASYQLAGYLLAWNAMHPAEPVDWIAVLQLKADGTYRYHDIAPAGPEQVFLAACVIWQARHGKGTA